MAAVQRRLKTALRVFRLGFVLPGFVVALAAMGCAPQGSTGSGDSGGSASTGPTTPVPAQTSEPSGGTGSAVPPAGRAVIVNGVIERGVEPGCFILTPDRGGPVYLVLGVRGLPVGVPVTVRGTISSVLSYCQQGIPLQASSVQQR